MRLLKKNIMLVLLTSFLFGIILIPAQSAYAEESGVYDNVPWKITDNNELVIGEKGKTYTYTTNDSRYAYSWPWSPLLGPSNIKKVTVEGTVNARGSLLGMFFDMEKCESFDLKNLNTANATSMVSMFAGCSSVKDLDCSTFNTSNVTDMVAMFANCSALEKLDISSFDTSAVIVLNNAYNNINGEENILIECLSLKYIALGSKTKYQRNDSGFSQSIHRYKTLDGNSVDSPTFGNLLNYDGSAPGWYVVESEYENLCQSEGHYWGERYQVDKVATCVEEGYESKHCLRCNESDDSTKRVIQKKEQ